MTSPLGQRKLEPVCFTVTCQGSKGASTLVWRIRWRIVSTQSLRGVSGNWDRRGMESQRWKRGGMSDFSGFDDASSSAIETDFADEFMEVDDLGVDDVDTDFPDPVDGSDALAPSFEGADPIVVSDGTSYAGYEDFVTGPG